MRPIEAIRHWRAALTCDVEAVLAPMRERRRAIELVKSVDGDRAEHAALTIAIDLLEALR